MAITPTYPGVYIEEIPSGVRTIVGVATSITAFIGRTLQGEINKATTVNSFRDFERIFGGIWVESPMTYAVRDFFQNGGSNAVIVRLYKATSEQAPKATIAFTASDSDEPTDANIKFRLEAASEGAWGNSLRATIQPVGAGRFNLTVRLGALEETLVNLTFTEGPRRIDRVLKENSSPVRWPSGQSLDVTVPSGITHDVLTRAEEKYAKDVKPIEDELSQLYKNKLNQQNQLAGLQKQLDRLTKELDVLQTELGVLEAEMPPDQAKIDAKKQQIADKEQEIADKQGEIDDKQEEIDGTQEGIEGKLGEKQTLLDNLMMEKQRWVGSDGQALTADSDYLGSRDVKTGLYALEDADLFNLLCIPPGERGGNTPVTVYQEAMAYCRDRRAMLIVDPVRGWGNAPVIGPTQANRWLNDLGLFGLDARNAVLYFPYVDEADPARDGQLDSFVPCGLVAGIMARTDSQRGVWKAPAGIDAALSGVQGLQADLTNDENGHLNQRGINCLRRFPVIGNVVWGARTLRGADQLADEYKYVPVRRLALYIEESLYRGTQWVVFEPNDEPLWAQIRLNVGSFMNGLFRQGAFKGITPREAYFVKCDAETNPQNDIDRGIVNIHIGFAPLKPAEFVILKIQQITRQLQF